MLLSSPHRQASPASCSLRAAPTFFELLDSQDLQTPVACLGAELSGHPNVHFLGLAGRHDTAEPAHLGALGDATCRESGFTFCVQSPLCFYQHEYAGQSWLDAVLVHLETAIMM